MSNGQINNAENSQMTTYTMMSFLLFVSVLAMLTVAFNTVTGGLYIREVSAYVKAHAHYEMFKAYFEYYFYFSLVLSASLSLYVFVQLSKKTARHETIKGDDFVTPKTLTRKLKGADNKGDPAGIKIGELQLPFDQEFKHFFIEGLPGSGKTVSIIYIMIQAFDRGKKFLIHDPKNDFAKWIPKYVKENNNQATVIYSPWDNRTFAWKIGQDVRSAADAVEIAKTWVIDNDKGDNHFIAKGQDILSGLIMKCIKKQGKNWSFTDLAKLKNQADVQIIIDAVEGARDISTGISPYESFMGHISQNDQGENFISTKEASGWISSLTKDLSWIDRVAATEKDNKKFFSVNGFKKSDKAQGFILVNNDEFSNDAEKIYGALMKQFRRVYNSSSNRDTATDGGLWMFLDEYPMLGKSASESVLALQQLGRSKGIRCVLAIQDENQLIDIFGKDKAHAQISMQQTQIYGTLSEMTAKSVSERIGNKTELIQYKNYTRAPDEEKHTHESAVIPISKLRNLAVNKKKKFVENVVVIKGMPCDVKVGMVNTPFEYEIKNQDDLINPRYSNYISLMVEQEAEPKTEPKVESKPEQTVESKPEQTVESKPEPKVETDDDDDLPFSGEMGLSDSNDSDSESETESETKEEAKTVKKTVTAGLY